MSQSAIPPISPPSARIGPAGIRVFAAIMHAWRIEDRDAAMLLGEVPPDKYLSFKEDPERAFLDTDALKRVSLTMGIYSALHTVFGKELADTWVRLPNSGPMFRGATPLAYMLSQGIAGLEQVRRKLDGEAQAHYL